MRYFILACVLSLVAANQALACDPSVTKIIIQHATVVEYDQAIQVATENECFTLGAEIAASYGEALEIFGNLNDAIARYQQAANLDPTNPEYAVRLQELQAEQ